MMFDLGYYVHWNDYAAEYAFVESVENQFRAAVVSPGGFGDTEKCVYFMACNLSL